MLVYRCIDIIWFKYFDKGYLKVFKYKDFKIYGKLWECRVNKDRD